MDREVTSSHMFDGWRSYSINGGVGIEALNEPGYMEVIAAASTRCLLIKPGQLPVFIELHMSARKHQHPNSKFSR